MDYVVPQLVTDKEDGSNSFQILFYIVIISKIIYFPKQNSKFYNNKIRLFFS